MSAWFLDSELSTCSFLSRPKHPLKVHVWAGISLRGPTKICIFDGTMDAVLYVDILRTTLLPFIAQKYPEGHRFMQDNDLKHTSGLATDFLQRMGLIGGKRLRNPQTLIP